jgi:hypothetical protein
VRQKSSEVTRPARSGDRGQTTTVTIPGARGNALLRAAVVASLVASLLCIGLNASAQDQTATSDTLVQVSDPSARRDEPGLDARRARYTSSTGKKIALAPVRLLMLPFQMLNYPIERWLIRGEPVLPKYIALLDSNGVWFRYGGFGLGSGYGGGIGYRLPNSGKGNPNVRFFAGATFSGYEEYYAQMDSLRLGRTRNRMQLRYHDRPSEDVYGFGVNSSLDNRSTYRLQRTSFIVTLERRRRHSWLEVVFGVSRNDLGPGQDDRYPTAQEEFQDVPGALETLTGRYDYLEIGAYVGWDRRDNDFYPFRGNLFRFGFHLNEGIRETTANYSKYGLELQQFIPLGGVRRTLALRFNGVITDDRSTDGAEAPVFSFERLGGSRTVRAYRNGRFIDEDMIVGNVEYRYPMWWVAAASGIAMDVVAFFDFGTIMPDLSKMQQKDIRNGAGFALYMTTARMLIGHFLVGWTSEGARLDLGIRGPIR